MLIEVAVGAPVRGTFTYEAEDPEALVAGRRLVVPFGARRAIGISLGETTSAPAGTIRKVERTLDDGPVFSEDLLALLRFASDHYLYPLGEALRSALPPDLGRLPKESASRQAFPDIARLLVPWEEAERSVARAPRQAALVSYLASRGGAASVEELRQALPGAPSLLRRLEEKGLLQLSFQDAEDGDEPFAQPPPGSLTRAQRSALDALGAAFGRYETFLLHGVTGSGKTEVYLQAIGQMRERGKGALVLVPEIALTPQLAGRFRSRFGKEVAVLHSGMGDKERTKSHRRLLEGEATIALGARSVIFAPVRELGIIVVDEEHDPSFKQEEKLRYHARDLAVVRSRLLGIPCVLGSATPSLESLENARQGKYSLLELPERIDGRSLPAVQVVDLSDAKRSGGGSEPPILGEDLLGALEQTLSRGEQAILFLNRRGHAPLVLCPTCGESASCTNCDVGLTYHRSREELRCHYCDLRVKRWSNCPTCDSELLILGVGTERLEKELAAKFPTARVSRLDRDTASTSAKLTSILTSFARREADVLVGTQMIAKGHDFPGVTLVGVVLADIGLGIPDFRASERTFQLLTQVAGRAGRGHEAGRVVIQTFHREAEAIDCAKDHDYRRFAKGELERRRTLGYPPVRKMLAVRVDAVNSRDAERLIDTLGRRARAFACAPRRPGRARRRSRGRGPGRW